MRPLIAKINLAAIEHNMRLIKKITGIDRKVMAVVKADGYGHGAGQVAAACLASGADRLAIAVPDEGIRLRKQGFTVPIQILGTILPEQVQEVMDYDLIPAICTFDSADALSRLGEVLGKKVKIHIKVDTGMGRIGVRPDREGYAFVEKVAALPGIELEGVFTHFATADELDKGFARKQLNIFQEFTDQLKKSGLDIPICHAANSAGILTLPESHLDMVRPGIILYGLPPSHETERTESFCPAMSLIAKASYVKKIGPGDTVSYGRRHTAREEETVVTIPGGYADGINRHLSNRGEVLLRGKRCLMAGSVCMDQFMTVYDGPEVILPGEEAVLMGQQGKEMITATDIADICGTINYEIVCAVSARVPRIYVQEEVCNVSYSFNRSSK